MDFKKAILLLGLLPLAKTSYAQRPVAKPVVVTKQDTTKSSNSDSASALTDEFKTGSSGNVYNITECQKLLKANNYEIRDQFEIGDPTEHVWEIVYKPAIQRPGCSITIYDLLSKGDYVYPDNMYNRAINIEGDSTSLRVTVFPSDGNYFEVNISSQKWVKIPLGDSIVAEAKNKFAMSYESTQTLCDYILKNPLQAMQELEGIDERASFNKLKHILNAAAQDKPEPKKKRHGKQSEAKKDEQNNTTGKIETDSRRGHKPSGNSVLVESLTSKEATKDSFIS